MRRLISTFVVFAVISVLLVAPSVHARGKFSWGWNRDSAWLDRYYPAPCMFPPIPSPCAAPCRWPGIQCQSVPCAFETACPSRKLPCHGVSYGYYPYPIFR